MSPFSRPCVRETDSRDSANSNSVSEKPKRGVDRMSGGGKKCEVRVCGTPADLGWWSSETHGALTSCRQMGTRASLVPVPPHSSPANRRTSYASSLSLHSQTQRWVSPRSLKKRRCVFLMPQGHRRRLQRLLRPLLGHSLCASRWRRSSKWPRVSAQGGCSLLRPLRAPGAARLPRPRCLRRLCSPLAAGPGYF